jgi:hypothetical protein
MTPLKYFNPMFSGRLLADALVPHIARGTDLQFEWVSDGTTANLVLVSSPDYMPGARHAAKGNPRQLVVFVHIGEEEAARAREGDVVLPSFESLESLEPVLRQIRERLEVIASLRE